MKKKLNVIIASICVLISLITFIVPSIVKVNADTVSDYIPSQVKIVSSDMININWKTESETSFLGLEAFTFSNNVWGICSERGVSRPNSGADYQLSLTLDNTYKDGTYDTTGNGSMDTRYTFKSFYYGKKLSSSLMSKYNLTTKEYIAVISCVARDRLKSEDPNDNFATRFIDAKNELKTAVRNDADRINDRIIIKDGYASYDNGNGTKIFMVFYKPVEGETQRIIAYYEDINVSNEGYLRIIKSVPTGYSPVGATFGVYASQANANSDTNRITTLTITSGNTTSVAKIDLGTSSSKTVWIKELNTPTSSGDYTWIKDTSAHAVTVSANTTSSYPATYTITNNVQEYGYAKVYKRTPSGYNPTGAEYTVYMNEACTIPATYEIFANGIAQKFIINADGYSNTIKFIVPTNGRLTLYVKESKIPNATGDFAWSLDETVYKITITKSSSIVVNSFDDVTEYGYGQIIKKSSIESQQNLVEGAEFTVLDSQGQVAIDYITDKPVILTVVNGKTEKFCLKVGTYTIKETKTPNGFTTAPDRSITITKGQTETIEIINTYDNAYAYVIKTTDRPDKLNEYSLVNTKIGIYTDPECKHLAIDVLTGEQCILTVLDNLTTNKVCLGLGKYYVKEISTTPWYELNTKIIPIELKSNGETYTIELSNSLKKGLGQVEKGF